MTTTNLPTVEFAESGHVDAAHAAYVALDLSVWIRHPSGGSVLVSFERDAPAAYGLAASLNDVLGAWARLHEDEGFFDPCQYTNCHANSTRTVRGQELCGFHADEYEQFISELDTTSKVQVS